MSPAREAVVAAPTAWPADSSLDGLRWLWQLLGQGPSPRERWLELLRLAVTSAERPVRCEMLTCLGQFAQAAGDLAIAQSCFQEALVVGRACQHAEGIVRALDGLTGIAVTRGAFELARTLQDDALAIRRRLHDDAGVARTLAMLGWLNLEAHGRACAETLLEESLAIRLRLAGQSAELRLAQARGLLHLGWLALLTDGGDRSAGRELARTHLAEALALVEGTPGSWAIQSVVALFGQPALAETPVSTAVQLLVGAELLDAAQETAHADPWGYRAEALARLSPAALVQVWAGAPGGADAANALVGQALCAGNARSAGGRPLASEPPEHTLLTPRELEVARLIGKGYTNRRIADDLIIGERTAETHARNIREKLGMSTRAQIAAWAAIHAT